MTPPATALETKTGTPEHTSLRPPVLTLVQSSPTLALSQQQRQMQQQLRMLPETKKPAEPSDGVIPPVAQQSPQAMPSISPINWAVMQMRSAELARRGLTGSDYRQIADYTAELHHRMVTNPQGILDEYYGAPTADPITALTLRP